MGLRGTWPITVSPSAKVTIPVGTPAPVGTEDTVAVKVIAWPNVDGLCEELTMVVDALGWTFCTMVIEELECVGSPLYAAVMKWLPRKAPPAVSAEVVIEAWPFALRGILEASVVVTGVIPLYVRSVKVTVPVPSPDGPLTDAVNVSGVPTTTLRKSGIEELIVRFTVGWFPSAKKIPPLSVYTVPSGQISVGTYGSRKPGVSTTD